MGTTASASAPADRVMAVGFTVTDIVSGAPL
jgi:hypothetical protein